MKNRLFWLGMLVMALVFGMTVLGCDDDGNDGSLNGTWSMSGYTMTIAGSSYTISNYSRGSISYRGSTMKITSTQMWSGSSWSSDSTTVTCNYSLSGNKLTISNVSGGYSYFAGTWTR